MHQSDAEFRRHRADQLSLAFPLGAAGSHRDLAPPFDMGDGQAEMMRERPVGAAAGLDPQLPRRERRQQARFGVHQVEMNHRRSARRAGGGLRRQRGRRGQLRGGGERQRGQQQGDPASARDQSQPFRLK
jgi:hypothetical protein